MLCVFIGLWEWFLQTGASSDDDSILRLMSCSLVDGYQHFTSSCCLNFQDKGRFLRNVGNNLPYYK
jgi:hypothetical protein